MYNRYRIVYNISLMSLHYGVETQRLGSILPDYTASTLQDVDFERLQQAGKTNVLVDLDLTLRSNQFAQSCRPELISHLQAQKAAGNISTITVVTNSKRDLASFVEPLDANYIQPFSKNGKLVKKPDPSFFEAALSQIGVEAEQAVMIGDRYQLDVVGAYRAGITTVLVDPLGRDYPLDLLKRSRSQDRRAHTLARTAFSHAEIRAYTGYSDPDDETFEVAMLFQERLDKAKPYLFSLATKVINTYPEHKWDLMIVDDVGARLVGRFLRFAMKAQGIQIPTAYICGSNNLRKQLPEQAYEKLAETMTTRRPNPPRRPLLVTETVGTGATLQFFDKHLGFYFDSLDYAIAGARYPEAVKVNGDVYYGGEGRKAAMAITTAFERTGRIATTSSLGLSVINRLPRSIYSVAYRQARSLAEQRGTTSSNYALTGVETPSMDAQNIDGVPPIGRRAEDRRFGGVANYCSVLIKRLAEEFSRSRG